MDRGLEQPRRCLVDLPQHVVERLLGDLGPDAAHEGDAVRDAGQRIVQRQKFEVALAKLPLAVVGFRGLAARADVLPGVRALHQFRHEALRDRSWASLIEEWRRVTVDLVEAYASGVADVDPAEGACRYCELGGFCRIDERAAESEADEATPEDADGD